MNGLPPAYPDGTVYDLGGAFTWTFTHITIGIKEK